MIELEAKAARRRRSSARDRTTWPSPSAAGSSTRTTTACSTCRCRGLLGGHQVDNAGLAVATLRPRGREASRRSVRGRARQRRLAGAHAAAAHPVRWSSSRPPGADIWLDGGHNPAAGAAIATAFAEIQDRDPRPLVLISGMLTTKDPAGFFRPFAGLARHAMTVPVPDSEAGFDPETLAKFAMEADVPARPFEDVRAALAALAPRTGDEPPRILICGSLYLARRGAAERTGRCRIEIDRAYRRFLASITRARALDPLLQVALRAGADLHVDRLAVLEHDQRRDRAHAVADRRLLVLVDVQLDDLHLAAEAPSTAPPGAARSSCRGRTIRPRNPPRPARRAPSTSVAKLASVTAEVMENLLRSVAPEGRKPARFGSRNRHWRGSRASPALFPSNRRELA